jgi:rod shape-determining protein MreC
LFQRYKASLLLGLYSFLCLAFLSWSADRVVRSLQIAFHYLWAPSTHVLVDSLDQAGRFSARLGQLLRADQRARQFESRWLQERLDTARMRVLEEENKKWSDLYHLSSYPEFRPVAGRVWGRDAADWFHSVLVRPGEPVSVGDAVITVEHNRPVVIGQVRDVNPDGTVRVLLLTDSFSALSAKVGRTGELGLIEGRGTGLLLNYLFADSGIQAGDEVVTAGLGGVYPPNLLVGRVSDVLEASGSVSKRALVSPAARLGTVREVLILSGLPPRVP